MVQTADGEHKSGVSHWLRTGRLPTALGPEGVELKFNPWHDPEDGRFTFAGAGSHYGSSGADPTGEPSMGDRSKSRAARHSKSEALRVGTRVGDGQRRAEPGPSGTHPQSDSGSRAGSPPNPVAEFVGGVGEGLYDVGKETVTGVHAALTTNPVTTIRNAGRGIAGMIDTAIAAEDTPARIQVSCAVGGRRQRLVARYWSRYGGGRSKRRIGSHAGGSALQGFRIAPPSHGEAAPDL